MQYIADLHIHSPYSRATSKLSTLTGLFAWARVKGINLVGSGDFTHPGWFQHLKENLREAEPGFFRLRDEAVPPAIAGVEPEAITVRFTLTAEISSIYKKHGKVRKIHNILFAPNFSAVEKINRRLASIGNIESDGRPILGLDSRDLLEIILEDAPGCFLVPAHIWTPWFSLFGSKSGFDAIEDCFGDLSEHIFALETGLSSDPEMNRLVSALDRFTLISNSDCHSPSKLGREANLFDTGFDFFAMREALKKPELGGFKGTVEFYPEEGKYHYDGHRKCGIVLDPQETKKLKGICPVCGKGLTIGVTHRVMELADRETPVYPEYDSDFHSLIPLNELIGEILGRGPNTKGVMAQYGKAISRFGSEFNLFFKAPLEDINQLSPILGESINRVRNDKVIRQAGYDGEFGVIKVFEENELDTLAGQKSLFSGDTVKRAKKQVKPAEPAPKPILPKPVTPKTPKPPATPNSAQEAAVASQAPHILVSAGPGTGKTFTLVTRLARLLSSGEAKPARVAAITFTNRAADEIRARLVHQNVPGADTIFIGTFHNFCLHWIRRENPETKVIGADQQQMILRRLFPDKTSKERKEVATAISEHLNNQAIQPAGMMSPTSADTSYYLDELEMHDWLDIEGIIPLFVHRLNADADLLEAVHEHLDYLFVDEFQDLNQAQYEMVQLLGIDAHVFAIGDPNQAIYGFRGSDLLYFFNYGQRPDTTTLSLTHNYRSAPEILESAASVISNNKRYSRDQLEPQSQIQGHLELYSAPTEKAEAEFVVKRIEEILGGISHFSINSGRGGTTTSDKSFADVAVLYRLNRQADALAEALEKRGIPFQRVGAQPYFLLGEMKALYHFTLAVAGLAVLPDFLSLLGGLPGIGSTTLQTLENKLPPDCTDFFAAIKDISLPDKALQQCFSMQDTMNEFQDLVTEKDLQTAFLEIMPKFGIKGDADGPQRFLAMSGIFGKNIKDFASHLKKNENGTVYDENIEAVALMTLHAAKGLEFPVVFLPGLEEGILPCGLDGPEVDLEEERRIFYMGLTRAEEILILSNAKNRTLFGESKEQKPSKFIDEIPTEHLHIIEQDIKKSKKNSPKQMSLF